VVNTICENGHPLKKHELIIKQDYPEFNPLSGVRYGTCPVCGAGQFSDDGNPPYYCIVGKGQPDENAPILNIVGPIALIKELERLEKMAGVHSRDE
jgi:hypothetical protein